jgi:hypothetical protein
MDFLNWNIFFDSNDTNDTNDTSDTNGSTNLLDDNNIDLLKVYSFDNKIRLAKELPGYVIGDLNIKYDCFINFDRYFNPEFIINFIDKYKVNKDDSFVFENNEDPEPIKNIVTFIKKNIGFENNEHITNLSPFFEKYDNIFIKMNIEGGEWQWLQSMDEIKLNKISQIVIEFHGLTNHSWHGMTNTSFGCDYNEKILCLKKLSKTHYLIHAHGNNTDVVAYNGLPNIIELIYINKNIFNKIPELNSISLPIKDLDFPIEKKSRDINLNFYPFVNKIEVNPFLIDIPDKEEYNEEDYINIQKQIDNKNIDHLVDFFYFDKKNWWYNISDFKSRISKGIRQNLTNFDNNILPIKKLYKIGNGGNNRNCIVSFASFSNKTKDNQDTTRFNASQNIHKSLEETGFNGYFYLFNGGFPNPTGTEMKYIGVPYCFKIFMMLEAYKKGFDKVIWLDSGCYALNNPEPLFNVLYKDDALIKTIDSNNDYDAMVLENTMYLLNRITKTDLHNAKYFESIVFGLNLESKQIKNLIKEYYEMVKLGYPFFSIFPEEIVLASLFNKNKYKDLITNNPIKNKVQIHEKRMNEESAKNCGYYFHHKNYSNYNTSISEPCYITFNDERGRFGNQLFRYLTCKLFTIRFGHKYISGDNIPNKDFIKVNEENINDILENDKDISKKNIVLDGYFQKSDLFVNYREKLIEIICNPMNDDYFVMNNKNYYLKEYLINSKHNFDLNPNDILLALRLDDFILYPCKTSDIIPPEYYIEILEKMKTNNGNLYIVCDKIKLSWEFKYLDFFKKYNPILVQESLIHDIALMRDSNILIHSNSSLCWIISFLSHKDKRLIPYTPKIYMNQNQCLKKIQENDTLNYVTPLDHDEVHNLDINNNSVFPLSFCIPDECVVEEIPEKIYLLASLIPGDTSTYIFNKYQEKEYNDMYRKSRFAITKMKGGWDCLRHYEILMNGCIPLFENLKDCPRDTLTSYPKHLNDEAYELFNNWVENEECINKYNILCSHFLEHTRKNCTTSACAKYFLKNIRNGDKIKNVLLITGNCGVNYNRETLWIGLKRHIKSIHGVAVEYEKMPFLYDDFDNLSENNYYRNNCYTFPKRLQKDDDYNMSEHEIIEKINNNFWDLIIYGKVGPDEFCTFPFYDIVKTKYNKNKIAFIYGGDEIFNLKITDCHSYHINMFNRYIYYKPYSDYLNYYKQFGNCFVRELER